MAGIELPDPGRVVARIRELKPARRAMAAAERAVGMRGGAVPEDERPTIAPHDAGWAELFTGDGETRLGRGQLLIWPGTPRPVDSDDGPATVEVDAALPTGGDAPPVRGVLRSFTVDAGEPVPGDSLMVRPEKDQEAYPVLVRAYDARGGNVVYLDWPDETLPASLRELGGQ